MRARAQRFDPRQIMNNKNFEVFHYKDANPSDGEMHHHDFYEVCCFLGGEVVVALGVVLDDGNVLACVFRQDTVEFVFGF